MAKRKAADALQVRAYLYTCPEDQLTAAINEAIMARNTRFPRSGKRFTKNVAKLPDDPVGVGILVERNDLQKAIEMVELKNQRG